MAITRAQQVRQMLKKGSEPVVQGGVENYLGRQPEVQAPRKWQSGPNKPPTELAYITEAEKDLLLKEDIHGSLKDGPNEGPAGIISLDSFGDIGGGQAGSQVDSGRQEDRDAGTFGGGDAGESPADRKAREAKETARLNQLKAQQEERAKEMQKEARATRKKMRDLKRKDQIKRTKRIEEILKGTYRPNVTEQKRLRDLQVLGFKDPQDVTYDNIQDILGLQEDILGLAEEKDDTLSGVDLRTFQDRFELPETGVLSLDAALSLLGGPLKAGSKKTRTFFTEPTKNIFGKTRKSVLEAGKLRYKGQVVTPEAFAQFSPLEKEEVYKSYMADRMAGKTDAYGNLAPGFMRDAQGNIISTGNDGRDDSFLPIANQAQAAAPTPIIDPTRFRFMNRGGMVEDAPMGTGIMDLESARQMMFIGGVAKAIGKGLKSATRAVKKVVKSPFGKAALLAAPFVMGGGGGALSNFFGKGSFNPLKALITTGPQTGKMGGSELGNLLARFGLAKEGNLTGKGIGSLFGITSLLAALQKPKEDQNFDLENYYETEGLSDFLANLGQRNRFLAEGGRVGLQEGGGIEQRLEQLGGDVTSAEQTLQEINQRLESAESNLGSGGGIGGLPGAGGPKIDEAFFNPQRPSGPGFANRPLLESLVPPTGTLEQPKAVQPVKFSSVEDAFADAQKNAQEARAGGFLGRVVLPGEMSFEDFSKNFNRFNNFGQPMQLSASGGLGGAMRSPIQQAVALAEGGKAEPVAKKTMPLLDLDGQEMDFRAEGGFVPIGRMEKADDVPARLSKNEFVFTAEAVRNAGDGDVDKGAEVMYNTMKNLEAGGKVSEETQGLDGAKKMFQTAQRLEGVM